MGIPPVNRLSRQTAPRTPRARPARLAPPKPASGPPSGGKSFLPVALVWVLIVYLAVPATIFLPPEEKVLDMSANPVSRALKMALLLISVVLVCRRIPQVLQLMRRMNVFLRVFLVLVPLSYAWSISPGDTLARFVSILTVFAVSVALCLDGWHPQRFQTVVRPVVTFLLIGSVIFGLAAPDLAIDHGIGSMHNAWHGLCYHKNLFGQLATFGLILWLHGALSGQVKLWQSVPGCALSGTCVVLAHSSTSLMASAFVSMFMLMSMRSPPALRRYMPYLVAVFAIIVLTYALAVLNILPGTSILLEPITALTGKDMTFSNRSEIWRIVKENIQYHPILGSGYGAYWIGPVPTSPSYTFMAQMYFYPSESHNGYLEIVNDLGYVGLLVLIGFLTVYLRQGLQLMRMDRAQGVLYLGFFFQQAITNLSESCWLVINAGFVFTIITLAVVCLARSLLDSESRLRAARRAAEVPGAGRATRARFA
jgi:exopolysaccharide production protein ExoQ